MQRSSHDCSHILLEVALLLSSLSLTPASPWGGLALWDPCLALGSEQLGSAGPAGDQQLPGGQQQGGMFFPPMTPASVPSPGAQPGNHSLTHCHLCCARLCLPPSICGQSSGPAFSTAPCPYIHSYPASSGFSLILVSCDRLLELGSLAQPTHAPGFSSPQEQASPGQKLPFPESASSLKGNNHPGTPRKQTGVGA